MACPCNNLTNQQAAWKRHNMGKKMSRINEWYKDLMEDFDNDETEIASGLGNGVIEKPEWMSVAESTDHVKIWDNETDSDQQFGFIKLDY